MSKEFDQDLTFYNKEIQKMERAKAKIKVRCAHQDKKGNLKVKSVGGDLYECTKCGETFKLEPPTNKELQAAYIIMSNAINQIKIMADPAEDEVVVKTLGELQFNMKEAITLYENTMNKANKKKKNKKKNKESNYGGSYGSNGLW